MQALVKLQESIRQRAVCADLASAAGATLSEIWTELVAGHYTIADWFFTEERCLLLLTHNDRRAKAPLDSRRRETLESVLLGVGQKSVAHDLGVAVSTVATLCKQALEYLNIGTLCSKAPVALVVFVHAFRELTGLRVARRSMVHADEGDLLVVSFPRPEHRLAQNLSLAEYSVARLYVEGCTHAQIAKARHTSRRTVANQLASVFQKLDVSGRTEFLARLVQDAPTLESPRSERPALLLLE